MDVSVVIPAFDEVDRIGATVERVLAFLSSRPWQHELIVVLDGGRPGADVVCRRAAGGGKLLVLDNGRNRGKGFSVRRGVQASSGDYVAFIDADLSLPIENLDSLLEALERGADVAIGSRFLSGSVLSGERQPLRNVLGKAFNEVVRGTVLPGFRDTQCGLKAFRGTTAKMLFQLQRIDGFSFDVEVLAIALQHRLKVAEVPVTCEYRRSSTVRWVRDGPAVLRDLARIAWNRWRGHYETPR
jgi:dolichyl-phosphate beta-glucosyltransferase